MFEEAHHLLDRMAIAQEEEKQKWREKVDALEKQIAELKSEVGGLKGFLDTHDESDGGEISSNIDHIHNLVQEFATQLTYNGSWQSTSSKPKALEREKCEFAQLALANYVHPILLHILINNDPQNQDETKLTFLQYALQTSILINIQGILEVFCCGLEERQDQAMLVISNMVKEAGQYFGLTLLQTVREPSS